MIAPMDLADERASERARERTLDRGFSPFQTIKDCAASIQEKVRSKVRRLARAVFTRPVSDQPVSDQISPRQTKRRLFLTETAPKIALKASLAATSLYASHIIGQQIANQLLADPSIGIFYDTLIGSPPIITGLLSLALPRRTLRAKVMQLSLFTLGGGIFYGSSLAFGHEIFNLSAKHSWKHLSLLDLTLEGGIGAATLSSSMVLAVSTIILAVFIGKKCCSQAELAKAEQGEEEATTLTDVEADAEEAAKALAMASLTVRSRALYMIKKGKERLDEGEGQNHDEHDEDLLLSEEEEGLLGLNL